MARGMNLYRRGAVYWWRRRLNLAVLEKSTISLSLSLLTRELSIARARGAAMTMASEKIRMTIHKRISTGLILPEQANRIANEEAKAFRLTLMMVDANLVGGPELPIISPDRSKVCLEQFWTAAEAGGVPDLPSEEYAVEQWPALSADERQQLLALVHRVQPSVGLSIDAFERLREVGVEPSDVNLSLAKRLIVRSRAQVAREAVNGDLLGEWLMNPAEADASHGSAAAQVRDLGPAITPLVFPPVASGPDPFGSASQADRRILNMTPVELADHYISTIFAHTEHRKGGKRAATTKGEQTIRQIRCAARLLQQSVPEGTPFSLISADQVQAFDSFLDKLPISFGKSPKDRLLETRLMSVCNRTIERVALGDLSLDEVGLELPTTNKHFRCLQRMRDMIERLCPALPIVRYSLYVHSDLKCARNARQEYTLEQGRAIFSLPPWTGCVGVEQRLAPGSSIIHDALYWVLLLVWYTGARREEICAIMLTQVRQEHGVDYIEIIEGKTINASRRIAIASELKRLGFLAYVEALRASRETRLFPEIEPGRRNGKLGDVFYKLWWIYLKPLVPGLVPGQAMHSCRHTVSTELKDLQVFPEFRNDLLGHGKASGGEGVTRYPKATRLHRLQEVVDQIPIVTEHLPVFDPCKLVLLPPELRRTRPTRLKKEGCVSEG